jgi:hypothetical protein
MTGWKLPPKEKIYEAFSVLADRRYAIKEKSAAVKSSDGQKEYLVEWITGETSGEILKISSNDNASFWQGYPGYPIIAILMLTNNIQFNEEIIPYFRNIPWKVLNKAAKNNYASVVLKILDGIGDKKAIERITGEVDSIYRQIEALKTGKLSRNKRPPKQ